jgi:hypothetical protein
MSKNTIAPAKDDWEKRYEMEEDVKSLARAAAIKKDPERLARAIKHAKTMKAEHEKRRAESDAIIKMADSGKK